MARTGSYLKTENQEDISKNRVMRLSVIKHNQMLPQKTDKDPSKTKK